MLKSAVSRGSPMSHLSHLLAGTPVVEGMVGSLVSVNFPIMFIRQAFEWLMRMADRGEVLNLSWDYHKTVISLHNSTTVFVMPAIFVTQLNI